MSALQNLCGRFSRTTWSLAAIAALAFTMPTPAQFGLSGGIQDAFRPAFTTRDVQLAVDSLQLDDAQKFILTTLFEDYEAEFETGVNAFRTKIAGVREDLDPAAMNDPTQIMKIVFGTINEWREESRQLADQFTADLRDLLNEEQAAQWPAFERKLFRLKFLKNGQLPGETLDLMSDVRDLDLATEAMAQVQPLLDEYELRLDEVLRRREDYMQRSQTELIDAIQNSDYGLSVDVAERQVEYRKAVRDVNEQYTETIAARLPSEASETFMSRILERTYPRVYRKTPAQRAFEAAVEIEELDDKTRDAVVELNAAYLVELNAANGAIRAAIRDYKPKELTNKVQQAASRLSGAETAPLTDPSRDKFMERGQIDTRYMEQLRSVLTPEQFAALPSARRWLDPEDRAEDARRRATPAKGLRVPGADGVPRALSGSDDTGHDDDDHDHN